MVVLMKILQVILALSVLIIIHELGHFFFAKLFRTLTRLTSSSSITLTEHRLTPKEKSFSVV